MKRVAITISALIFSLSFCMAQNIREEAERQRQREAQQQQAAAEQRRREQQAAEEQKRREEQQRQEAEEQRLREEQQRQEAEEQRLRELELRYQNTIASAESNFIQRQYAQAMQDYLTALELKPENAAFIKTKMNEIDMKMNEPASLYIYRKRKPLDIFPKRYEIFLDNALAGNSTGNWKTTITVDTFGSKTLSATIDGRKAEVRISFEPGGVYYVRSDVNSKTVDTGKTKTTTDKNGKTTTSKVTEVQYTPILQLVDKSIGMSEFNAIVEK